MSISDQTPTPTRFLKNCEEVGLFNELASPFDHDFKKSTEDDIKKVLNLLPDHPTFGSILNFFPDNPCSVFGHCFAATPGFVTSCYTNYTQQN